MKLSNSPAFLYMRLQMCINALFLEHFYGHCIKIKLYMHVFYSYLLKKYYPFALVSYLAAASKVKTYTPQPSRM